MHIHHKTKFIVMMILALFVQQFHFIPVVQAQAERLSLPDSPLSITSYANAPMGLRVNTYSGGVQYIQPLLSLPSERLPIELALSYSSHQSAVNARYGMGWQFSYNIFYEIDESGAFILYQGDGSALRFVREGGVFLSPQGIRDVVEEYQPSQYRLTMPDNTVMTFDNVITQSVSKIADAYGNELAFNYHPETKVLASMTDNRGRVFTFTYTNNRLATISMTAGDFVRTVQLRYNDLNNLLGITDPVGNRYHFVYDNNRLVRLTDPNGSQAYIAYDAEGIRAIQIATPLTQQNFSYSVATRTTTMTQLVEGAEHQTYYVYDADGRISTISNMAQSSVVMGWDDQNNLLSFTDANRGITRYTYDARGNRLSETDALGNTTTFAYDDQDHLISATDALGNLTTYAYDEAGSIISATPPNGGTTQSQYDARGNLSALVDALGNITTYTYDTFGYLLTETSPFGGVTTTQFSPMGELLSITDETGLVTSHAYDPNGNLIAMTANGTSAVNTYDPNGNLIRITNSAGTTFNYAYDALNRLVGVTDALGNITTYRYDALGNLVQTTDALGRVSTSMYDVFNNPISHTNALGETITTMYDALGNLLTRTTADGNMTTYRYDFNNNPTAIIYADNSQVTFAYDALNRRVSMTDATGTTTYGYNSMDNITRVTYPSGDTLAYSYNLLGQVQTMTYPDSSTVNYTYTIFGNIASVTDDVGTTYYLYTGNRKDSRILPDGTTTTYAYNDDGLLAEVAHFGGVAGEPLLRYAYTYNEAGLRDSETFEDFTGIYVTQYAYNALSQLIGMTYPDGTGEEYAYDAVGNRIGFTTPFDTMRYDYDSANRLMRQTSRMGEISYGYDQRGNLLTEESATGTTRYAYDLADNLADVTTPQGTVSYVYDGDNNRVARIDGDQRTDYILSYGNILSHTLIERDATGTQRYVVGNERLYRINSDNSVNFYLQDGQGSIAGILTPDIGMTQTYRYTVHGKPMGDVSGEIFAYTGESYDAQTGLIYLRARYYDPDTARFINRDPLSGVVSIPTTQNGYLYAENNPVNMIDPTGEFFWFLIPLAIMVVKAVATSVVAGAVIGGIVEAANGGNFFEGMGRGVVDAFKDPLSYIPLPGVKNLYSVARYGFKVAASVSKLSKAIKVYKGAQAAGRSIAASGRITAKSVFMTPYWSRIKGHRVLRLGVGEDLLMGLAVRGALYPFRGDIRAGINSATQWIADGVLGRAGYTRSVMDTETGRVLNYYNNPDGQLVDYGQFALWDANGIAGLVGNPAQCIAAPASQVQVGDTITTIIPNLQIRAEPSIIAPTLGALAPNTTLSVVDGPVCGLGNGQYAWWLVDVNGTVGWVAEGDSYYGTTPRYFVAPPALAPATVATGLNCPKAPPQLLQVNDSAVINTEGGLVVRLRNRPGGAFLEELTDGTRITIINPPLCNEFGTDYRWWQVRTSTGSVGWIADGDMTVEPILYFVVPLALQGMERGRIPLELGCPRSPVTILRLGDVAIALEGLRLRESAGGNVIREMSLGTRFEVVGGPTCNGESSWWQVRTTDDTLAWVAEGDITRYERRYFINLADRDATIDDLGFDVSRTCGSALPSRLTRDMIASVSLNVATTLSLRTSPFAHSTEVRGLDVGEFVVVLDGPICGEDNQLAHWLVRTSAGEYGWVAESNSNLGADVYFIEPYASR